MSGITQCPHCKTRFRVHQSQLEVRQGLVCCGRCQHAFDALTNLLYDTIPTPANTAPVEPTPSTTTRERLSNTVFSTPADSTEPISLAPSPPELLAQPVRDDTPNTISPSSDTTPTTASNRLLLFGVLALLLALSLQLVFSFRTSLVSLLPSLRPSFTGFCQIAGCTLELPKEVGQLSLVSSSLEAIEEANGQMRLTAAIRNHANVPQTFPHLQLSLTNQQDVVISRRVFEPKDYLPADTNDRAGLSAGETFEASLLLVMSERVPTGFKLLLFYPTTPSPKS